MRDLTRFAWLSIAAALITLTLKAVAAAMTGSVGLLSDAAESIVNLVAAVVALVALRVAARPPDEGHNFGHGKAEYLSASVEAVMIFVAAVAIIVAAVDRLLHPRPLEDVGAGLAVSAAAGVVNGAVAVVLVRAGRRYRSLALTADGKHLLTDVWTSVGVIVGVVLVAVTGYVRLDPIVALLVGVNIVVTGAGLLSRSVAGLMDHAIPAPALAELDRVLGDFAEQRGVSFHVRPHSRGRPRPCGVGACCCPRRMDRRAGSRPDARARGHGRRAPPGHPPANAHRAAGDRLRPRSRGGRPQQCAGRPRGGRAGHGLSPAPGPWPLVTAPVPG